MAVQSDGGGRFLGRAIRKADLNPVGFVDIETKLAYALNGQVLGTVNTHGFVHPIPDRKVASADDLTPSHVVRSDGEGVPRVYAISQPRRDY